MIQLVYSMDKPAEKKFFFGGAKLQSVVNGFSNGKTISGETLFSQINFAALTTTEAVLNRFTVANAGNSLQGGENCA